MLIPPYLLTEQALTIFYDGRVHTVHSDSSAYALAVEAVAERDFEKAIEIMKPAPMVERFLASSANGRVRLTDSTVYYDGEPVDPFITNRTVTLAQQGAPVEPLLNLLERLYRNTSFRVRKELLGFLEYGNCPITSDGCFLAWKRINHDYTDCWTGKIDNSVGRIVEMDRAQVDDNCNNTCSYGLHFCSLEYLGCFHGARIVVLKIDPADVVSIPTDYNNTKGRTCRYQVVGELPSSEIERVDAEWRERGYVDDFEPESEEEEENDEEFQFGEYDPATDRYW